MEWQIARIERVSIEYEDHGFLTCWAFLDYGGSGQGFGGYALGHRDNGLDESDTSHLYRWITEIMRVVGVESWDKVAGHEVLVLADGSKVHGIRAMRANREFFPQGKPADAPTTMAVGL